MMRTLEVRLSFILLAAGAALGSGGCTADSGTPNNDGGVEARDGGDLPDAGSLRGWELNETNTGLAPLGLSCDQLEPYTGPEKVPSGTLIREKRVESGLDLSAGDITIERSCIRPTAMSRGLSVLVTTDNNTCTDNGCAPPPAMVTVRDSEIDGSLIDAYTICFSSGFLGVGTVERNYIHDVGSGIAIANAGDHLDVSVQGNYVHRLRAWGDPATTGSHNDGFTIRDFSVAARPQRRAVVRNNRFDCSSGNDTGAFFIQTTFGDIDQVLVEGNLLEGNGFQLVLEAGHGSVYGTSLRSVDNRFSGTGYGPGYVEPRELGYGWAEWTENYLNDPSASGNRGAPVADPSP